MLGISVSARCVCAYMFSVGGGKRRGCIKKLMSREAMRACAWLPPVVVVLSTHPPPAMQNWFSDVKLNQEDRYFIASHTESLQLLLAQL